MLLSSPSIYFARYMTKTSHLLLLPVQNTRRPWANYYYTSPQLQPADYTLRMLDFNEEEKEHQRELDRRPWRRSWISWSRSCFEWWWEEASAGCKRSLTWPWRSARRSSWRYGSPAWSSTAGCRRRRLRVVAVGLGRRRHCNYYDVLLLPGGDPLDRHVQDWQALARVSYLLQFWHSKYHYMVICAFCE